MNSVVTRRVLLMVGGLALSLLIAEGALRLLYPRMTGSYQDLYVLNEDVGYTLKPGLDMEYRTGEYATHVQANRLGFRDDEHADEPAQGTFRIMVLGDSITEALQVPFEVTFHQQLERQLSTHGRPVEIVTLAAGGYGLVQEYAAWRRYGRRVSPHVVLLVLCPNDVEALPTFSSPPSDVDLRAAAQRLAAGFHGTFWTRAYRRLHLYSLARNALWQSPAGKRVFDGVRGFLTGSARNASIQSVDTDIWARFAAGLPLSADQTAVWNRLIDLIATLGEEVGRSGGHLAVVMIPLREYVDLQRFRLLLGAADAPGLDLERPDHELADALKARRIPFFSCGAVLRQAAASGPPLYFRYDAHLSARGHEIVADALERWVGTWRFL